MTTPEDNELIAKFMGAYKNKGRWKCKEQTPSYTLYGLLGMEGITVDQMRFDTSWDWLMPVVEKIGGMWSPDDSELSMQAQHICELPLNSHIQQVYKEVISFIRWYDTTKQSRP